MGSWIKICLISFVLVGCKSTNENLFSEHKPFKITQEIKFSPYAMQTISINNENEQLFFLNSVSNTSFKWSNSDKVKIYTINGKIVKTFGFDNDFEIKFYEGFKNMKSSEGLIKFNNPESGFMQIFFSYELIKDGSMKKIIDNSDFQYTLIKESFNVPLIKWSGANYYWVDKEMDIWQSKQIINPFNSKIRLKVLKKYSD
tara:strand:+ start:2400 stop:2999 length:600 start_codon:yes stop_codon:yes gene_type:complete